MSLDDSDFEQIVRSFPPGLIVTACPLDSAEILLSFCYSLKGAAIRCGSNAMLFLWGYSRENWKTRGIEHLRNFIEKHNAEGVRLFLVNSSPTNGSINEEIAALIRHEAVSRNVTVIVTAIAQNLAVEILKRDPSQKKIKKSASQSMLLMSLKNGLQSGSWKGILLERHQTDDDWYSATAAIDGDEVWDKVKRYGPLYFTDKCPQPPESWPQIRLYKSTPASRHGVWSLLRRFIGLKQPPPE
jgi:hypothetical protein